MEARSITVKILDSAGITHGAGCIIAGSGIVITCTHVLNELETTQQGEVTVMVPEHCVVGTPTNPSYQVTTIRYLSFKAATLINYSRPANEEDLSFLQLLPANGQSLPLFYAVDLLANLSTTMQNSYSVYGFPKSKNKTGLPGACTITGSATENNFPVFALNSAEITAGFSGGGVWDNQLQAVVGIVISILKPDEYQRLRNTAFMIPVETIWACYPPSQPSALSPYLGLSSFDVDMADYYFGRDRMITELFQQLGLLNLYMVIGVSGSGKSSLVRAGLKKGQMRFADALWLENRSVITFNIGKPPVFNFIFEILKASATVRNYFELQMGRTDKDLNELTTCLLKNFEPKTFSEQITKALGKEKLLIAIDQFERLFTEDINGPQTEKLIDLICQLSSPQIKIILALRIEFYKEILTHPKLGKKLQYAKLDLLQMNHEEVMEAIREPAIKARLRIEGKLLDKMAYEYIDQAGSLPHLQFALSELWIRDHGKGMLTNDSYLELSRYNDIVSGVTLTGAMGIIVRKAEQEVEKHITEIALVRRIFLSLVAIRQGLGADDIVYGGASRRAFLTEFEDRTRVIATELADSFLLTSDLDSFSKEPTIGVAHESLLQSWPRLRGWIVEAKPFLFWLNLEFQPYYDQWLRGEKSIRFLLPMGRTKGAKLYLRNYETEFQKDQKKFIRQSNLRMILIWMVSISAATIVLMLTILFFTQKLNSLKISARAKGERGFGFAGELYHNSAYNSFRESLILQDTIAVRQALIDAYSNKFNLSQDFSDLGIIYDITNNGRLGIASVGKYPQLVDLVTHSIYKLPALPSVVAKAKISTDGRLAVLGLANGDIDIWDIIKHRFLQTPPNRSGGRAVGAIAIGPGGLIAYGYESRKLFVCTAGSTNAISLQNQSNVVWAMVFNRTGSILYGGDNAGNVVTWRREGNNWQRDKKDVQTNDDVVIALDLSPEEKFIATGGSDAVISILSLKDGQVIRRLNGHGSAYSDVKFTSDGNGLFSGGEDGVLTYWDLNLGQEWAKLQVPRAEQRVLAVRPMGSNREVICTFLSGRVIRGRLLDNDLVHTMISTRFQTIKVMDVSNDNHYLAFASGDESGQVQIWDLRQRKIVKNITALKGQVLGLTFNANSRYLATSGDDNFIRTWKTGSWKLVGQVDEKAPINALAADSAGNFIAGTSLIDSVHSNLLSLDTGRNISVTPFPNGSVFSVSTTRNYLMTGGGDSTVKIYDMRHLKSRAVFQFPIHQGSVWATAIDRKGSLAASGAEDRTIRLYAINADFTGKLIKELTEHKGGIYGLAFNPVYKWMASCSNDQTVKLWDLNTYQSVTLKCFHHPVYMLKFSNNGKKLYICGLSNEIQALDFENILKFWKEDPALLPKYANAGE